MSYGPHMSAYPTSVIRVPLPRQPNQREKEMGVNQYLKPEDFDPNPASARFFVIKSYTADDVHKAMKYGVWASTKHGNKRLDEAYKKSHADGPIYLFFSVNGSGCFCGLAKMESAIDYDSQFSGWCQGDKWGGQFKIKFLFIKNLSNKLFIHIRLPNNSNKPVTNSRDTQEVFLTPGKMILDIFSKHEHSTSLLDEFNQFDIIENEIKVLKANGQPVNQLALQHKPAFFPYPQQNRGRRGGHGRGKNRGRGRGGHGHGGHGKSAEQKAAPNKIMARPNADQDPAAATALASDTPLDAAPVSSDAQASQAPAPDVAEPVAEVTQKVKAAAPASEQPVADAPAQAE